MLALVAVALLALVGNPAQAQDAALPAVRGGLGDLLSRPMPGTPERADADAASRLQSALVGFAGIASAHVIVSRDTQRDSTAEASRRAAVQLTFTDEIRPDRASIEGIAAFVVEAVPGIDPARLTIVDVAGQALYVHGAVLESQPVARSAIRSARPSSPKFNGWLLGAAGAGGMVAALVFMLGRGRTARTAPEMPEPAPSEFCFLADLTADELARVLTGERPELLRLIADQAGGKDAARIRELAGLAEDAEPDRVTPSAEVVVTVAEALRRKLVTP